MMKFDIVGEQKETRTLKLSNLLGVDFTNTELNVAPNRATYMENLIHEVGLNRKRQGWEEVLKLPDKEQINGCWRFIDKFNKTHTIVYCNQKFYAITKKNNDSGFDTKSVLTQATELTTPAGITLNKENVWAIENEGRLYILCGTYLVYGSWDNGNTYEIRQVANDIDTYIPTTTIGISAVGSMIQVRTTFEEVNMLSSKRINKLIGESLANIDRPDVLNLIKIIASPDFIEKSIKRLYLNTNIEPALTTSTVLLQLQYETKDNPYLWHGKITGNEEAIIYQEYYDVYEESATNTTLWTKNDGWLLNKIPFFNLTEIAFTIVNQLESKDLFFIENEEYEEKFKYYLDTKADGVTPNIDIEITYATEEPENVINIEDETEVVYKRVENNITLKSFSNALYAVDENGNKITEEIKGEVRQDEEFTSIELYQNYPPMIDGQNNIEVKFSKTNQNYLDDINNCTFGEIFNAQGGQFVFISGNPNKPSIDWHTEYGLGSTMKTFSDLTYIPDLSYARVGNENDKIIGYTQLGDGVLAIHKQVKNGKDMLFIRSSYLDNAIDASGAVVKSLDGRIMKKVYFPINLTSVGEGMITRHSTANLLGDNLFLSKNGVFGLSLSRNITSSERFALDRSSLINGKLVNEPNLETACAIAFDNRYYLAINDTCYVADARFKNYLSIDMPDTFSYEWWYWTNIPAKIWFVLDNELYFGTSEGRICKFYKNSHHVDRSYYEVTTITHSNKVFSLDNTLYAELITSLKDGDGIMITKEDGSYLTYNFNGKAYDLDFECEIMDYDNGSFKLFSHKVWNETEQKWDYYPYEINVSGSIKAYFVLKSNVKAKYVSPIFDLGTTTYSKKITNLTVVPKKITNSQMSIKLRTRNFIEKTLDVENAGLFDFSDIDFANFTFNTDDFPTSFNKKLRLKCNFVQLTMESDNERDCGIHNIVVEYIYSKKNKGER